MYLIDTSDFLFGSVSPDCSIPARSPSSTETRSVAPAFLDNHSSPQLSTSSVPFVGAPESFSVLANAPTLVSSVDASSSSPEVGTAIDPSIIMNSGSGSGSGFSSTDFSAVDWNDHLDLGHGTDLGTMFAFDDLYPQGFDVTPLLPSSPSSPASAYSGFLGSGNFLEM
jgi:hypothetical protein